MPAARSTLSSFPLRYAVVAGACAVLHNLILIGAAWVGAGLLGAASLSFCLMVVIGYLAMCLFAFRTSPVWHGFVRYTVAMAANFPLTTALLWLFTMPLQLPVALVAPMVTALMVGINFTASRWALRQRGAACAS